MRANILSLVLQSTGLALAVRPFTTHYEEEGLLLGFIAYMLSSFLIYSAGYVAGRQDERERTE